MDDKLLYRWTPPANAKVQKASARTNLTKLYKLEDLAFSVRRLDEAGNKVNRQSKTYKKQVSDLQVLGGATLPSATSRKYLLDLLLSGAAQRELEGGFKPFTKQELERSFTLRPGALQGHMKSAPSGDAGKRG